MSKTDKNSRSASRILLSMVSLLLFAVACSEDVDIPIDEPIEEVVDKYVSSLDSSLVSIEDEFNAIFIENISFSINSEQYEELEEITFEVSPKDDSSIVDPFKVTYSKEYISSESYLDTASMQITFPLFGLYDAYLNTVTITSEFSNGKSWHKSLNIETDKYIYTDYDNRSVNTTSSEYSGYSYMFLETDYGSMIMDIEGNVRWCAEEFLSKTTTPSRLFENNVYCKLAGSPFNNLLKLGFDGSQDTINVDFGDYPGAGIHHEMNIGPNGLFLELNIKNDSSVEKKASVLVEVDFQGNVVETWDMDDIIGKCLSEANLPVDTFIRNALNSDKAIDWFHMNSSIYDESDNTVIISAREDFVIKVGYDDKEIKWILGDTTKYWYSIDTLRHYALDLTEGNINVGQHSLSILDSGELMLFNNGENSWVPYFPKDMLGITYEKSMISSYSISEEDSEAREVLNIELPYICPNRGSVHENGDNYIVNYLPEEPDFNSVIAIYSSEGEALLEIKNLSYFCVQAYGFNEELEY